jgi:hypothetical protein
VSLFATVHISGILTLRISLSNNLSRGRKERGVPMREWEELYQAAILETDWSKVEDRIQKADSAISARLHEFSLNHGGTPEENQRIQDALNALKILRREVADWHGSKRAG